MGYLAATLMQVFTRARSGADVSLRDGKRGPRWEMGLQSANDVTHRKRAEDFGRFEKSQLVEQRPALREDG